MGLLCGFNLIRNAHNSPVTRLLKKGARATYECNLLSRVVENVKKQKLTQCNLQYENLLLHDWQQKRGFIMVAFRDITCDAIVRII